MHVPGIVGESEQGNLHTQILCLLQASNRAIETRLILCVFGTWLSSRILSLPLFLSHNFFFSFRFARLVAKNSGLRDTKKKGTEERSEKNRAKEKNRGPETGSRLACFLFFSLCTASSNVFLREAREKSMVSCLLSIEHKARWKGEEKTYSNLDGLFLSISISFRRSTLRSLSISNFHFWTAWPSCRTLVPLFLESITPQI